MSVYYAQMDSRLLREMLILCEEQLNHLIEVEHVGYDAYAEHFGEGKTLKDIDKEFAALVEKVHGFICNTGVSLAGARVVVRETLVEIDKRDQALQDRAEESRMSPGPNDPRSFIDIRVAFPTYQSWR